MPKRFLTIWFCYLKTDWVTRRQPRLRALPFVLATPDHGRMVIAAVNALANMQGINTGMVVADARVILPSLEVLDDKPELSIKLLKALGEWCIRYTPIVAIDPPEGLILDVTGCAHLWGGEKEYITSINKRFKELGYHIRIALADTIGASWAIARFGKESSIVERAQQAKALLSLPPAALRLQTDTLERLEKLGLRSIHHFIAMPRAALRRRFGQSLIQRLDQALGNEEEMIQPLQPIKVFQERLPCLEPIVTATGIEIALQRLLTIICHHLQQQSKGLRTALFKCYRVDGKMQTVEIGTHRASRNTAHLFKLFELKLGNIEPDLGIELFILEAPTVEEVFPLQENLWKANGGLDNIELSELVDRLAGKMGAHCIHRYVPEEHYWPERSLKPAVSPHEKLVTNWKLDRPRPLHLLSKPELIEVTAPIPDYPPMLFRYKGKLHKIIKADGPERIEQEWWLQQGQHRDYYSVEDEEGSRYWLFRLGHYDMQKSFQWFIHGFFA
jgi:protein ImuB